MSNTWEEPAPEGNLAERLRRLERIAERYELNRLEEQRLQKGVDRLGDSTEALTAVLTAVEDQARAIGRVEKRTDEVQQTVADTATEARKKRREQFRRWLATTLIFVPLAAYVAIWHHELYRDACDSGVNTPAWCNAVFPGDTDGNPLQDLVIKQHNNLNKVCRGRNEQVELQAGILRGIAAAEPTDPQSRRIADGAAILLASQQDCDALFPVIDRGDMPGHGH